MTRYIQSYSVLDLGVDIEGIVVSVSGALMPVEIRNYCSRGQGAVPEAEFNIDRSIWPSAPWWC